VRAARATLAATLVLVPVAYYTFERDGEHNGLLRRTETPGALTLERMTATGAWVDDPSLFRYFDFGNVDLEKINERQARELADRYGGAP
jgi:hypothetical protein